ncbi:MAG: stage V sporulation T C-terminal domain-containing protein [Oscillospiraceae bacterium]|nr:stage V sporulation T C-terminal domain-containing protein [Oscillospiraceae bacterium]
MKATGIVRRIDDLGRVVIPKEIRRTLRIREGDPLEIYTEKDGEVIFKKYSPMSDLSDFSAQICDSILKNTGHYAAVADRDSIICAVGAPRRDILDKHNSHDLEQIMAQRSSYRHNIGETKLRAVDSSDKYYIGTATPILAEGDLMGCVLLLSDDEEKDFTKTDQQLTQTVASFLGRQMES